MSRRPTHGMHTQEYIISKYEKILELVKSGYTIDKACKKTGVERRVLYKILPKDKMDTISIERTLQRKSERSDRGQHLKDLNTFINNLNEYDE